MRHAIFITSILGISMLAVAQQPAPKVANSNFHTDAVAGTLSAAIERYQHANEPLWVGYAVPAVPGSHFSMCSGNSTSSGEEGCCGVYALEGSENNYRTSDGDHSTETNIDVLVRIDQGIIDKVRFVGSSCRLDAGGLPFAWLTDVKADESVAWLSTLVTADHQKLADQSLAAVAMHATPKASAALEGFASSANPMWLREKASFWLGAGRGHEGYVALKRLANDPDPEFRKKLSFDLFVSRDDAATEDLIHLAKADSDTSVREQAIFWVGQKAGKKSVAALNDAIENDPEVAVKKKAVFAISQLPKDQAVPELLRIAQTNPNPAVRKDAIFWLGQTHDPRALEYFEQILKQ